MTGYAAPLWSTEWGGKKPVSECVMCVHRCANHFFLQRTQPSQLFYPSAGPHSCAVAKLKLSQRCSVTLWGLWRGRVDANRFSCIELSRHGAHWTDISFLAFAVLIWKWNSSCGVEVWTQSKGSTLLPHLLNKQLNWTHYATDMLHTLFSNKIQLFAHILWT